VRSALVVALTAFAESRRKNRARDFLQGLSGDELQYIAEFLGACILESPDRCPCTRGQLAERIAEFQRTRTAWHSVSLPSAGNDDHKMILLLEYLCRSGRQQFPVWVRTAGHA